MHEYAVRDWPCTRCPWCTDTDLTEFSVADMRKLARASGQPGAEAPHTAQAMCCHLDQPGTSHPMRLCAGWLAAVGADHLGIRLAVMAGHIRVAALHPGAGWPTLHTSFTALINSWPDDPEPTRPRRLRRPSRRTSRSPRASGS